MDNISKSFVLNDYKDHVNRLVIDYETGLLATNATDALIRRLEKEKRGIYDRINYHTEVLIHFFTDQEREVYIEDQKKDIELRVQWCDIQTKIRRLTRRPTVRREEKEEKEEEEEKKVVVIQCPGSSCAGFLVGWKCNICETHVCYRCRAVRKESEEHTCKQEDLDTVHLIRGETKPCPNCNAAISKDGGCDVMWCTSCKTGFYWRSLQIIRNHNMIHNPHFFNELARVRGDINHLSAEGRPRPQQGDFELVNECTPLHVIINRLYTFRQITQRNLAPFYEYLAFEQDIHRFPVLGIPLENTCKEDRISYINGEITKETFEKRVTFAHKKRNRVSDYFEIVRNYAIMCQALLYGLMNDFRHINTNVTIPTETSWLLTDETNKMFDKCKQIHADTVEYLEKVAEEYGNQPYGLVWYENTAFARRTTPHGNARGW